MQFHRKLKENWDKNELVFFTDVKLDIKFISKGIRNLPRNVQMETGRNSCIPKTEKFVRKSSFYYFITPKLQWKERKDHLEE